MRRSFTMVPLSLLVWLSAACILQTETIEGPPADSGPPGSPGEPGVSPFMSNADGSIYYLNGGVGIGTAHPGAALDVLSSVNNGDGYSLASQRTDGTAKSRIRSTSGGEIYLETGEGLVNDFSNVVPRLTVTREGFVGIGTAAPSVDMYPFSPLLDIAGARGTLTLRTTNPNGIATLRITGPTGAFSDDWHINMHAGNDSTLRIMPKAGASNALVVTNNGDVGVGTAAPQATLDINGTARLAKYSSEPSVCNQARDGTIALTSKYKICVCNGSQWVPTDESSPQCSWS